VNQAACARPAATMAPSLPRRRHCRRRYYYEAQPAAPPPADKREAQCPAAHARPAAEAEAQCPAEEQCPATAALRAARARPAAVAGSLPLPLLLRPPHPRRLPPAPLPWLHPQVSCTFPATPPCFCPYPPCQRSWAATPATQGLTLVHFSAQRERFLWGRGCMYGLLRGCLGGVRGHEGGCRVYFMSETAQAELKCGRV
jgi:hypothetical protein